MKFLLVHANEETASKLTESLRAQPGKADAKVIRVNNKEEGRKVLANNPDIVGVVACSALHDLQNGIKYMEMFH